MPRGAATKKGRGGPADKAGQPSVLASPTESGVPDQPARRQQGARRGKGRNTSSISDRESSSVTEGNSQLSCHERIEKGLTRLGKKANDRPETVAREDTGKNKDQGDDTLITALLPSSSGPPTPTPTAQVRLSDLLGSDSNRNSPTLECGNRLTPADNLSTSALPCQTSPAPTSFRSSFQTARGTPTLTSSGSRSTRRSRGEKAHPEEEEVINSGGRTGEVSTPAEKTHGGAGSVNASPSVAVSSQSSSGMRKDVVEPAGRGSETRKKRGKRVRSASETAEEKEESRGGDEEEERKGGEERKGEDEEGKTEEGDASATNASDSDSHDKEDEESDDDGDTTSESTTSPSPAKANQRLRRGIHCKVEFDR